MTIQWYPGHIAKAERKLAEALKLVDVTIEVVDARLPVSTVNPRLRKAMAAKPTLTLLNKADLADPAQNKAWLKAFQQEREAALLYDAHSGKTRQRLIEALTALGEAKMQALTAQGRKRRPVRVMVVGMPNVGKSTVINSVVGRRKTRTGHKAGVTRASQWIRIHPDVELMDTPGIIPPRLDDEQTGLKLAWVSSVSDAAFDEEIAAQALLSYLSALYPQTIRASLRLPADAALTLDAMAASRGYLARGGQADILRTARAALSEFRQGRLGRLTLEFHPSGAADMLLLQ
ncbi:MAG: ribosome biogenesis GTPase YlqF [Vampirovibrionales bacterium]|nr:ribosome biogenesis GTPase YlqF [Vampirovibrionales bacterium]